MAAQLLGGGRRRRHGAESDCGGSFMSKALSLFLLVSFGSGCLLFARMRDPTGARQWVGEASLRSLDPAAVQQQSKQTASGTRVRVHTPTVGGPSGPGQSGGEASSRRLDPPVVQHQAKQTPEGTWIEVPASVSRPTDPAQGTGEASSRSLDPPAVQQQATIEAPPWTWNEAPPQDDDDDRFFLVFSTDCSGYQNWQSLALLFSADEVGQPGTLIRIASGCTEDQRREIEELHEKLRTPPRFQVHFTPDFKTDKKSGRSYKYFNKPFGLLDWLESDRAPPSDSIVALLDPDFIFLRPLTYKLKQDHVVYSANVTKDDLFDEVVEGRPIAQHYGLEARWTTFKVRHIAGVDSPASKVSIRDAYRGYDVGPPYIAHRNDMHRIAVDWAKFAPKVYEEYPQLLAEMYAYSISAAHNQLPHLRLDHYMVSDVDSNGEGWPFVDQLPGRMCGDQPDLGLDQPVFLHYCQFYRVEHYAFYKKSVSEQVFSCEAPLFKLPPEHLEDTHWQEDWYKRTVLSPRQAKRAAFSLCNLVKRINHLATKYKHMQCEPGQANMTESVVIYK